MKSGNLNFLEPSGPLTGLFYTVCRVSYRSIIYRIVEKFKITGSVLDKRKIRQNNTLISEKLDDILASIETNPRQSLHWLALQSG